MAITFYRNSKKIIGIVRENLYLGFDWKTSDEGHEYWSDIARKLERYEKLAAQSSECRDEIEELKRRLADLESRC